MLNLEDLKNRVMQFVSSTVNLFIRDRAVDQPRFTYVASLSKKTGGPDPESFGTVFRDKTSKKEYLVDDISAPLKGVDHYAVRSIKTIKERPAEERFDEETYKRVVILADAPIDIQDDLIAFLKRDCDKEGYVFVDQRVRQTQTRGTGTPFNPANMLA